MKKALIYDAGCTNYGVGGTLNHAYTALTKARLEALGWRVMVTTMEPAQWNRDREVEKFLAADLIICHTPGWWMGIPWQFKKFMDEIFVDRRICVKGDGRKARAPLRNYGTGGVWQAKHYLLATTWNAPHTAFDRDNDFFEGVGIDGVMMQVHKTMQFLGVTPLPTFMANDVIKNPTIEEDMQRWQKHLHDAIQTIQS